MTESDSKKESAEQWPVIGQEHIVHFLAHSVKNGKLSHAYGFYGPKGIGKKRLVDFFAKSVLCEKRDGAACGKCLSCARFQSGTHSDTYTARKEMDEKNIGIEAMHRMGDSLYLAPSVSKHNIALIKDAHLLSVDAQNSILKILEDPPSRAVIILETDHWDGLLPTLRSRLLIVRFKAVPSRQMIEYLSNEFPNLSSEYLKKAARLAHGKIEDAKKLLTDENLLKEAESEMESAIRFLKNSKSERLAVLAMIFTKSASFLEQQSRAERFAQNLLTVVEWTVWERLNAGKEMNAKISGLSDQIFSLLEALKKNITPKLAFERFVWNIDYE